MIGTRIRYHGRAGELVAFDGNHYIINFDDGTQGGGYVNPPPKPEPRAPRVPPQPSRCDKLLATATEQPEHIHIWPPKPTPADIQLARKWDHGQGNLHRMISARLAEHAVATHYRKKGANVQDIAATQLMRNAAEDWLEFDLLVDEEPIDVKNATRSEANDTRYVSHCVAHFKQTRWNQDVAIVGVVSDWAHEEQLRRDPPSVVVLGKFYPTRVDDMKSMLAAGPLELSLRDSGKRLVPPWLYAYEESAAGEQSLEALAALPVAEIRSAAPHALMPIQIATNTLQEATLEILTGRQRTFAKLLATRFHEHERKLDVLFLTILEQFVQDIQAGEAFHRDDFEELLYPAGPSWPAFIHDPLGIVSGLLVTLTTATEQAADLQKYKQFQLANLNILQARESSHKPWETVLAYCGGWLDNRPCGNTPLIIGAHELCTCHRLICDRCSHCSDRCMG